MVGQWQLPAGVTRGTWDYAHSTEVAQDYDAYFSHHGLFDLDQEILQDLFAPGQTVADLGCGTGRALIPLLRRGVRGLAIDLSTPMLQEVRRKVQGLDCLCIKANLVELDAVCDDSVDGAICLFSTLGMIHGSHHREQMLRHVRRMVRPGGALVVHVHNFWSHLWDPGGPSWVLKHLIQSALRRDLQRGDRYFPYRGVPHMYLHVFTRRELRQALASNGFAQQQWHLLGTRPGTRLARPWLLAGIRASGWIVVGR